MPSFIKIVQAIKKLKFNLPERDWTFGDGWFCVQLCIETLCKRATSVVHLTNFSFEFFYEIFTDDASPLLLYHGAKKSKMTKNSNQGGSCLKKKVKGRMIPMTVVEKSWSIREHAYGWAKLVPVLRQQSLSTPLNGRHFVHCKHNRKGIKTYHFDGHLPKTSMAISRHRWVSWKTCLKNGKHGTAELRFRGTEKFSACSQKEESKNKNYVDLELIDAVQSGMTRGEKEVSRYVDLIREQRWNKMAACRCILT